MQRYFNTTGFCREDWHYMVDPLENIEAEIKRLIRSKQYYLIHAPRQTGKTTLLHALTKKLNKEGIYTAVTFSIENAGHRSVSVEKAMYLSAKSLLSASKYFYRKTNYHLMLIH